MGKYLLTLASILLLGCGDHQITYLKGTVVNPSRSTVPEPVEVMFTEHRLLVIGTDQNDIAIDITLDRDRTSLEGLDARVFRLDKSLSYTRLYRHQLNSRVVQSVLNAENLVELRLQNGLILRTDGVATHPSTLSFFELAGSWEDQFLATEHEGAFSYDSFKISLFGGLSGYTGDLCHFVASLGLLGSRSSHRDIEVTIIPLSRYCFYSGKYSGFLTVTNKQTTLRSSYKPISFYLFNDRYLINHRIRQFCWVDQCQATR